MITIQEIKEIGELIKPHGIKGELVIQLDYDINPDELRCIVLDVDGIYVPFFLNGTRPKSKHTSLVFIDGVTSDTEAKAYAGKTVYALRSDLENLMDDDGEEDDGFYLSDLIGFNLLDENGKTLGTVVDYDDSTVNLLLQIEAADASQRRFFVPAAADLIESIDFDAKQIVMVLPEGLTDN